MSETLARSRSREQGDVSTQSHGPWEGLAVPRACCAADRQCCPLGDGGVAPAPLSTSAQAGRTSRNSLGGRAGACEDRRCEGRLPGTQRRVWVWLLLRAQASAPDGG